MREVLNGELARAASEAGLFADLRPLIEETLNRGGGAVVGLRGAEESLHSLARSLELGLADYVV